MSNTTMWKFSNDPISKDYRELADRLRAAPEGALHPDLWQRRHRFAERLYQMAGEPQDDHNRSVYQAVRLLVW